MTLNAEFAKRHWAAIAGSLVGILVLYYLLRNLGASSGSGSSTDFSGGASNVQALSAAASLQNAQINGQVSVAQLQSAVATNGIAASLEADLARTAAELAATQQKTTADTAVALHGQDTALAIQHVVSSAAVQQTAIEGATLEHLAVTAEASKLAAIAQVGRQVDTIQKYSKHASQDYTAIAPVLAVELGQPGAAASLGQSNASTRNASSTAATISAGSGVVSGILTALFA